MIRLITLAALSLFLAGCASFKELSPKPDIMPAEGGYIELKNDKENFMLDKGKKYYIKFPRPASANFYVVIHYRAKSALHTVFTSSFDDGPGPLPPVVDESAASDSISVYAVAPDFPTYYWAIDTVYADIELMIHYRYVPQWRYTFENKYATFREQATQNKVDRSIYKTNDASIFDRLDYTREVSNLSDRSGVMNSIRDQLVKLQSVFPPTIATQKDTAYERYLALRKEVEEEVVFQNKYATVLNVFQKEKETRTSTSAFLEAAPLFASFVSQRAEYPAVIGERARGLLARRMTEGLTYYDGLIRTNTGTEPLQFTPPIGPVIRLAAAVESPVAGDLAAAESFAQRFNTEAAAEKAADGQLHGILTEFSRTTVRPDTAFYARTLQTLGGIRAAIPEAQTSANVKYKNYACTAALGAAISSTTRRTTDLQSVFQSGQTISKEIDAQYWGAAENHMRQLAMQSEFLDPSTTISLKDRIVHWAETDIFAGVQRASEARVDAFVRLHETTVDDVPQLYADSVFKPVYSLTYSSLGQTDLMQKRKQIDDYLSQKKYYQFPENAIKAIYRDLTAHMSDRGVEKARAIVVHGSMYRGVDKTVRRLVTECDVNAPKDIERAKDYRRVFALPTTSNAKGSNEYKFRVRIQVPTEAQFPVFDVNIKLPQDVAEKANKEQWYDEITIDKAPIKNEGRFRITAPVAANNYECQITPVQMDKNGGHILEVMFKYPGFKVLEVSAMAQVPIIRKN